MGKLYHCTLMALCWGCLSVTAHATPYDARWYEVDFLGKEYPTGFALAEDKQIMIRADTDPDIKPLVMCLLKKNATYHPWNAARVDKDALRFKTFTLIEKYTLRQPFAVDVNTVKEGKTVKLRLQKGDTWEFLAYYAEGAFRMRYKGVEYEASQDLVDHSDGAPEEAHRADEWLGLTCANGATGWIFLSDVVNQPGFTEARITEFGTAVDLDIPSPDAEEK